MWAGGNLPAVIADLNRRGEGRATVGRLAEYMVAHLITVYFTVHQVNRLPAVGEGNAQLAAFAQTVSHLVIFSQRFPVGAQPHQIKLAWFGIVDAAVDPGDQQIAVGDGFDNRKAPRVLHFVQGARRRETAFAVFDGKANVGAGFIALFARDRPYDESFVVFAEGHLGPVFFSLYCFHREIYSFSRQPSFAAVWRRCEKPITHR